MKTMVHPGHCHGTFISSHGFHGRLSQSRHHQSSLFRSHHLHHLQAEFFLHAALGYGLDKINSSLSGGGPAPIGGEKARLSSRVEHVAKELGFQSAGHIRVIHEKLERKAIPRPLLNISRGVWNALISQAFNKTTMQPPFDPYENDVKFLLASYVIPYVGMNTRCLLQLLSGLLGVQGAQDGVIRTLLSDVMEERVAPYNVTVNEFSRRISSLRRRLDGAKKADEGLSVHLEQGAEKRMTGNIISANDDSLAISRTPQQVLSILYASPNASKPGCFFPDGASGHIAQALLRH